MNEILIQFSAAEVTELAKLLSLAKYFLDDYDNNDMVNNITNRVCKAGVTEGEAHAFREGGFSGTEFILSQELEEECEPLIELYNDSVIAEYLPYSLADRDFMEQYNTLDIEIVCNNPKMLAALKVIQKKYIDEFERYGVTHLRLEEPQ